MNREFLELYNRELGLFYEQAEAFAEEYPGVAERLGEFSQDAPDPMIAALMEAAAFLATRVQLKIKHEFSTFTNNLLEQLVPNFLAPVPSVFIAQAVPQFGDEALREGLTLARGSYLDALYRERERDVQCRYRLTRTLTIWPLEIVAADYATAPASLEALGLDLHAEAVSGLRLHVQVRSTARADQEPAPEATAEKPATWAHGLAIPELTCHLLGPQADSVALYELLFGRTVQIALRWKDRALATRIRPIPLETLEQIGLTPDESLFPVDHRVFRGFDYIRDYFVAPEKFLGFRLRDLGRYLDGIESNRFEVIFVFRDVTPRLAQIVTEESFALHAVPVINLFERSTDRILLTDGDHEFPVIADRTRYLEYEPHQILTVHAHFADQSEKATVYPLYASPADAAAVGGTLFYAIRRLQRRRTVDEQKLGLRSDYMGTDMFLTLVGAERMEERGVPVKELSIRALCSNRHLPEHLPVGETGADFILLDNDQVKLRALTQPTHPREPILTSVGERAKASFAGENAWRLINMLSLNHLGLVQNRAGEGGRALKDILALFADLTDSVVERRIRGIRGVSSRPISRRVRALSGMAVARGIEVTVTLEDKAFEGSGAFLLGAILDRFLADYVGLNQFTQTLIRTTERKEIMRWPPRMGRRQDL